MIEKIVNGLWTVLVCLIIGWVVFNTWMILVGE